MTQAVLYIVVACLIGQIAIAVAFGFGQLIRRWA